MFAYHSIVNAVVISHVENVLIFKKTAYLGRMKGVIYVGIHTELKKECSAFVADGEEIAFKSIILDQIYRRLKRYEQTTNN